LNIPVIAANVPGLNEVVIHNETGLLFEKMNVKDLIEKINLILNNLELKEKLINKAFQLVEKYSYNHFYNQLINLYKTTDDNRKIK
jgi:glycosyltransferase involved in cell wall biosynthesis